MAGPSGLTPEDFRPIVKIDAEAIIAAIEKGLGSVQTVADRPAAVQIDPAVMRSGSLVQIEQTREWYVWLSTSGATPDGADVLSTKNGPQMANYPTNASAGTSLARLVLLTTAVVVDPNAPINLLPIVYVSAATGNDQNAGDAIAPLATVAEVRRRWRASGSAQLALTQTVQLVDDAVSDTDPVIIDNFAPAGAVLVGSLFNDSHMAAPVAVVNSGAINHAGNLAVSVSTTFADVPAWSIFEGQIVEIVSSATPEHVGALSVVGHGYPGGEGQSSFFCVPFLSPAGVPVTISNGDTIRVVNPTSISPRSSFTRTAKRYVNKVTPFELRTIEVRRNSIAAPSLPAPDIGLSGADVHLFALHCVLNGDLNVRDGARLDALGSAFSGPMQTAQLQGSIWPLGCVVTGQLLADGAGAQINPDGDTIFGSSSSIAAVNGARLGWGTVATFGTSDPMMILDSASSMSADALVFYGKFNTGQLWSLGYWSKVTVDNLLAATCATTSPTEILFSSADGDSVSFATVQAAVGYADIVVDAVTHRVSAAKSQSTILFWP